MSLFVLPLAKTESCKWLKINYEHHYTRYNPVAAESSNIPPVKPFFLAVGRLEHERNFDRLIRAFHIYAKKSPDTNLVILGNGSLRSELLGLVLSLNLDDRVLLPGFTSNPYCFMKRCVALVSCSEYEGLSNVLLEAIALNTRIVVTDNCSSSVELTKHFGDGIVCHNSELSLATALVQSRNAKSPDYKTKTTTISDYADAILNLFEV